MGTKYTDEQLRLSGFLETSPGQWHKASTVAPRIQHPEPKPPVRGALVSDVQVPETGPRRAHIRFTLARCGRLLDFDNANASIKAICDALRHAGAIRDDAPEFVTIQVEQRRVAKKTQTGTEIEIEYLSI